MDDLQAQLKATFLEEATELLTAAEQAFLQLEEASDDPSIVEKIFRLAHNLKGSARAVGFAAIGEFTHDLESLLLKIKNKELILRPETVDLLLRCNDHLQSMVDSLKGGGEATSNEGLRALLRAAISDQLPIAAEPTAAPEIESNALQEAGDPGDAVASPPDPEENREKDSGFHFFEDAAVAAPDVLAKSMISELVSSASLSDVEVPKGQVDPKKAPNSIVQDESIRISLGRLETLVNNIGELVILQTVLNQQKHQIPSQFLQKTITQLSKITKDIQDISMGLRMVPLKPTFQKMQRIVRDTAKSLGKDMLLEISGDETELDKTVVDRLGDPLVHLIRNAVDHGIETADERKATGKPPVARITLTAGHRGGKIVIEVKDDGRGINADNLRKKALEKGIIKSGQMLSDNEAIHLIFHPGFSTKAVVTDISGRGVGLDVVKTNIEKILQGEVQLETDLGKGSCFRIVLPLTLAIIDGMVIRSSGERYVVPLTHVYESVQPKMKDIHHITGIGDVLHLRGENLPMHKLSTLLGVKGKAAINLEETAIVVRSGAQAFSVVVDEIVGRQQVVIKKLGDEIGNLKGISGGAILGDGCAALILDLTELVSRSGLKLTQASNLRGVA